MGRHELEHTSIILKCGLGPKVSRSWRKARKCFQGPSQALQRLRRGLERPAKIAGMLPQARWLSNVAGFLANWGMGGLASIFTLPRALAGFSAGFFSGNFRRSREDPRILSFLLKKGRKKQKQK